MKIEELRLGNITKQGIVFMIGYDRGILGCWFIKNKYDSFADGFVKADDIEPIPLTPEILEKAGFERCDKSLYYYYWKTISGLEVEIINNHLLTKINNVRINKVGYVHQLQNLIFTLTGEELEIKL